MTWAQLMITSCLASAGCVAFLIGLAVTKDLTNALCIIQKNIKTKRTRLEGVIKLHQFIEFHSSVKELSARINWFGFHSKSELTFSVSLEQLAISWMYFNRQQLSYFCGVLEHYASL